MAILSKENKIGKWDEFEPQEFNEDYKTGEKHACLLYPYKEGFGRFFVMDGIFNITTLLTNFILDITINSVCTLDCNKNSPTVMYLYNTYTELRPYWLEIIFHESNKRGYPINLFNTPPVPFTELKQMLDEAIYRSLE